MTGTSSPPLVPLKSDNAKVPDVRPNGTIDHEETTSNDDHGSNGPDHHHHRHVHGSGLITQAVQWLHNEKAKRASRRVTAQHDKRHMTSKQIMQASKRHSEHGKEEDGVRLKGFSDKPDSLDGLDKPEQLLAHNLVQETKDPKNIPNRLPSRKSSRLFRRTSSHQNRLYRTSSFDTDYFGDEVLVPSCDVFLDNSKTLLNEDGGLKSNANSTGKTAEISRNSKGWLTFKKEILRLAITLSLKGWRRVPLDRSDDITVERLSGALTNAVYVVSPPKNLELGSASSGTSRKPPPKLLLRIYGPQVEHLIDRDIELQILRRLAKKNIGPRLLGTFINGRFEEFFYARTLTPQDLRNPDISKQIAKRMRELHDGIELLPEERESGPTVWKNWDKWVERTAQVVSWTDKQILSGAKISRKTQLNAWRERGLICGVEWPRFHQAVETYRAWLIERLGGVESIKKQMVFAHNDTQYGNILRLEPRGESPLLLPTNEHKRLVVIDFEYASANPPGLEFANHFTEWCYNYHDPLKPYAVTEINYPTPEEQRRFLRSYIEHTPSNSSTRRPSPSPLTLSTPGGPSSSISTFMLDSRAPPSQVIEEESRREEDVERLMLETRLWRVANSAQWVAWGVVQATIPEMNRENESPEDQEERGEGDDDNSNDNNNEEKEEGEFDYLGYAQDRAMFFWGDLISLGVVSKNDLPQELLDKVKYVAY